MRRLTVREWRLIVAYFNDEQDATPPGGIPDGWEALPMEVSGDA